MHWKAFSFNWDDNEPVKNEYSRTSHHVEILRKINTYKGLKMIYMI